MILLHPKHWVPPLNHRQERNAMTHRRLATVSALVPLTFALLGLAGWNTGRLRLASVYTEFIPMAPATAVGFVLVSAALLAFALGHGTTMRNVVRATACLVFIIAFMELLELFGSASVIDWERALIGQVGTFGAVPLARVSPLTAVAFALVSLALGCLTSARAPMVRDLGGVLGSLALLVGSTVALGYAYGAPVLYGGQVVPMALTTGLAFIGTGAALVALAGPTSLPLRPFAGGAIRAERAEAERARAEKALRDSEILTRSIVEHLPQRIFVKDRNSRYVFCNSSYAQDLGMELEQIVGKDDFAFFPPELAEAYRADDRTVMTEGTIKVLDERYKRAGEEQWIHTTKVPHRDEQGEIVGVLGIFENITGHKRDVEALRTAEERTRFALQNAHVGIWDLDYTSGVLQWSDVMETQYGLSPGTFGGTFEAFVERIHPEDRASVLDIVGNGMKTGADFSVLHRTTRPDGAVRWLRGSGRIVLDEGGQPLRAIGISQDVTERRTLEAQFQQAQKMEAVGRLAGGVAHDFNNLLTVILGLCGLLLEDASPDDPRIGDIAEIQEAGTRAANLTRQLLAFSRKQIIEPTFLDLNVILADMRPMLGRLIREDVKVVFSGRPGLALVEADRSQVEQVVANLAVNAQDAMPQGGTLTIETANVELDEDYAAAHFAVKPGPYVVLTVTDSGTGMTPEVLGHLFEPFFTTKEVGKGTGLGLATVHGIVTRSGGSVNVYTEVGRGTSFKVYFPQAAGEAAAAQPAAPVQLCGGTERVLVVEDADGLRSLTRRLLERQGYTVAVAANAEEALRLFEETPCDVLLTDVVMPGSSGPELAMQLIALRPGLEVIYMSGYTDEAIVRHGVLKPGIAFLHKPFTADALGRKIREVLDK